MAGRLLLYLGEPAVVRLSQCLLPLHVKPRLTPWWWWDQVSAEARPSAAGLLVLLVSQHSALYLWLYMGFAAEWIWEDSSVMILHDKNLNMLYSAVNGREMTTNKTQFQLWGTLECTHSCYCAAIVETQGRACNFWGQPTSHDRPILKFWELYIVAHWHYMWNMACIICKAPLICPQAGPEVVVVGGEQGL